VFGVESVGMSLQVTWRLVPMIEPPSIGADSRELEKGRSGSVSNLDKTIRTSEDCGSADHVRCCTYGCGPRPEITC